MTTHTTTGEAPSEPRFSAAVVDLAPDAAARAVRDCGVFIVPQVRMSAMPCDEACPDQLPLVGSLQRLSRHVVLQQHGHCLSK
jgi:hypothetical protein